MKAILLAAPIWIFWGMGLTAVLWAIVCIFSNRAAEALQNRTGLDLDEDLFSLIAAGVVTLGITTVILAAIP